MASLKKEPKNKKEAPKPHHLEAMNKAIDDIYNGKGIPRFEKTGEQKIFQGRGDADQKRWKGAREWQVVPDDNDMRILTIDLGNGKKKIGFTIDHIWTSPGCASIELIRFATIYPASLWAESPAP
ncbi:hypothetical protein ID855_21055 [Xenorhabdus sp. ZM]|uniref:hypothetical protein n=1 Tax=Xenorhabdus szentirmaii TaxID=290112 RepID=UPI00198D1EAE|nr:hypothetical protein [Xenorhabdus sp. ZM]MBD2807099.1 hypothetical protein [Xenorhabdus sp. ZM]